MREREYLRTVGAIGAGPLPRASCGKLVPWLQTFASWLPSGQRDPVMHLGLALKGRGIGNSSFFFSFNVPSGNFVDFNFHSSLLFNFAGVFIHSGFVDALCGLRRHPTFL